MSASEQITAYIDGLSPWQRDRLRQLRQLIHETDPEIVEEWKWETPVFSHGGHVCAIGAFKDHVKLNFFKGASLADPDGLFNAGLEAKTSRAIDLADGDHVNEDALKRLMTTAIARNLGTS